MSDRDKELINSITSLGFSKKKANKVYELMRDAVIIAWKQGYVKGQEDFVSPPVFIGSRGMIVCTECGNKRCPKATDENLECTHSNEPGQKGSRYE